MSQPAEPLSTISQAGFGKRKPLPCTGAGVIPGERPPRSPVSGWAALVPSSRLVLLFLGSWRASWFSPLAGNFNSATFISPLLSRETWEELAEWASVSSPYSAAWSPWGGTPTGSSGALTGPQTLPCPSPRCPWYPQCFEDPRLKVSREKGLVLIVPWVQVNEFVRRWGAANAIPTAPSCCRESSPAAEAAFPLPVFHFELLEVLNKK